MGNKTSFTLTKDVLFEFNTAKNKMSELIGRRIDQDEALHILIHIFQDRTFSLFSDDDYLRSVIERMTAGEEPIGVASRT